MSIEVRKVTDKKDLEEVFRIRKEVFVLEQQVAEEEEFDEFESISEHFIAFYNSEPAGAARWRKTENGIKLERFAVTDEFRGKGIASALVESVLKDIESSSTTNEKLYLHAQIHAIPLYAKYGFEKVGDEFLECDIRHFQMERISS